MTDPELLAYCRERLRYVDGMLLWVKPPVGWIHVGDRAGCLGVRYRTLKVKKHYYGEHRVIWLMHHGRMPLEIDHVDGDPVNNRIENLRECTRSQNNQNRKQNSRPTTSRYKGVFYNTQKKKWQATIHLVKRKHLGFFDSEDDAAAAYDRAALDIFGEFALINGVKK
jgi:hypothetical protein